jgi:WD40 repeat protein
MKQQGHFNNMTSFAYSPDGQYIVTGGEDGKVSCRVAALLNSDMHALGLVIQRLVQRRKTETVTELGIQ